MLYTLLLGWGVLAGMVPFNTVYLLMALPCVAPIAWYGYGFVKVNETTQDFGLLLSALGWSFILISLLVRHAALNADLQAYQAGNLAVDPNNMGQSSGATICTIIGLLCIVIGAFLAFQAWSREMRRNPRF